jgi:hypothetical protein
MNFEQFHFLNQKKREDSSHTYINNLYYQNSLCYENLMRSRFAFKRESIQN